MRLTALSVCGLCVLFMFLSCVSPEIHSLGWNGAEICDSDPNIHYFVYFGAPLLLARDILRMSLVQVICFRDMGSPVGPTFDEYATLSKKDAPKQENKSAWTAAGTLFRKKIRNLAWSRQDLETTLPCPREGYFII